MRQRPMFADQVRMPWVWRPVQGRYFGDTSNRPTVLGAVGCRGVSGLGRARVLTAVGNVDIPPAGKGLGLFALLAALTYAVVTRKR